MIGVQFDRIRYRNFLSTGAVFTEIKFRKTNNTLIVGANGAGKSQLLDGLSFVLFGKAFRNINKPTLVNAVNGKECVVEVEFSTNNHKYKVIRGIKPTIFEIWKDGTRLNQDSASKDYQDYLEKYILKMNYKAFTQIVVLGSASYKPFMQLTPAERRSVIEDLLDIQIFTTMNTLIRQKLKANGDAIDKNRIMLSGKEEKKSFIERTITSLRSTNSKRIQALKDERVSIQTDLISLKGEESVHITKQKELKQKLVDLGNLRDLHKKMIVMQSKLQTKSQRYAEDQKFFHDHDNCPTCRQKIEDSFKVDAITESQGKQQELADALVKLQGKINDCVAKIQVMDDLNEQVNDLRNTITSCRTRVSSLTARELDLGNTIRKIESSDDLIDDSVNQLIETTNDIAKLTKDKEELMSERLYIETGINLLKDGGIKSKIIKQYLETINKCINHYLVQTGFSIVFHINEQFEETIKSRYCDDRVYNSHSEGEKRRIDLAILFAWRQISKIKNSVNTNLLILDEILDGSLDVNGIDDFLRIMDGVGKETNVFVISHRQDQMIDRFQRVIKFEKRRNFSKIVSIT